MAPKDASSSSLISKVSSILISDDEEVDASDTPFLDTTEPKSHLANFRRKELDIGKFLGRGRFTESHEIRGVERDLRYKAASMAEEKARLDIWGNTSTKGRTNFSIKRVRKDLATEREIERAALGLTIEANYLSRLDHQNIINLKALCETTFKLDDDTYEYHAIITNRITETLDERIDYWNEQESLSLKSDFILHLKTDYAFQIADALSYLHERRIIFRNLTLSSIGFTTNDTIQLTNFDCVKEIPEGESYLQDGFKGSQTYMSLEMYSGDKYDYKVDCFAWAICFYEMLTQEPAFQTTTNEEALIREHGWCPSLQDCDFVPDGLLDLLEDAWETDLDERITMSDIRSQLEWILFGSGDDESSAASGYSGKELDGSMEASNYLFGGGDMSCSALGLDLDESENFLGIDDNLFAAIGFSGTTSSFIPSELLLDVEDGDLKPAAIGPPPAKKCPSLRRLSMEVLKPKLEYTKQYRGLRMETIPPPAFVPANANSKSRRRASIQRTEMAVCA